MPRVTPARATPDWKSGADRASLPRQAGAGRWLSPLLAALLALPAAWPLLLPGFVATRAGGDSPFLLIRLHQLLAGLASGFPARWMPDAAYGLGYPFWTFYAPLPYYVAAFFTRLGLGYVAPIKLAQLAGFLVAAVAMYALAHAIWRSRAAGLLAAIAYTYAPFHLVNVYVRGDSLGEFWAFAFYPLAWLAVRHVVGGPTAGGIAALALAYAGLVVSHNISALIFSPFLALYILGVWLGQAPRRLLRQSLRSVGWACAAIALGLALSLWFWYPALAERDLVQLDVNLTGFFSYTGHFRGANLVQLAPLFNYDPTDGAAFVVGLAQAVAILGGVVAALTWTRGRRPESLALLVTLTLAVFAITPLSRPLWDSVPLLPFAQFPWRFLSIVAFAGALMTAALAARLPSPRAAWLTAAGVGGLLAVAGVARLEAVRIPVTDSEVTTERVALYEVFSGNIGTTIRAEYLPQTVNPRPYITPPLMAPGALPAAVIQAGQATATAEPAGRWRVSVTSEGADVAFPALAFPGRAARLDGQPVAWRAANGLGYTIVSVPRGEHVVDIGVGGTPARSLAEGLSLAALLVVAALLFKARDWQRAMPTALVAVAALWLVGLALRPTELPAVAPLRTETVDFIRVPWLHRNLAGVGFANGARLAGYTLDGVAQTPMPRLRAEDAALSQAGIAPGARAGETMVVGLTWAPTAPGQVDVALVSPAEHLFGISWQVANERVPVAPGTTHRLAIPRPTTPGLYWLRLRLQDAAEEEVSPLDEGGRPLGRLYLLPVYVLPASEPPVVTPRYRLNDTVSLADVTLDPRRRVLNVALTWTTSAPLPENYVVSLRLVSETGAVVATSDQPPGYGFFPTSAWPPGQPIDDRRRLALPDNPGAGPHRLEIILYHRPTLAEIGRTVIEGVQLGQ